MSRVTVNRTSDPSHGDGNTAVLFLQMGGPSSLDEVKPFLQALFRDPDLIRLPFFIRPVQGLVARIIAHFRTPRTREMYKQIGGGSPILRITHSLVSKIKEDLHSEGVDVETMEVMRYTNPRSEAAGKMIQVADIQRLVLFPLYPHYSHSTSGSSFKDIEAHMEKIGFQGEIKRIEDWSTAPFYIQWWANGINEALESVPEPLRDSTHVVFSAHGLPRRYVEQGDPYSERVELAAQSVMQQLQTETSWHLGYQSRVGPVEWLGPYVDETLAELGEQGVKSVIVVPLGFVSDHVETLYEIDQVYRQIANEAGISHFFRVPVPNDDNTFTRGLSEHLRLILED